MEVAGVEVDAEPVGLHGLDDLEEAVGLGHDAVVVLQSEEDPAAGRVVGAGLDGLDAVPPGFRFRLALLRVAREDADRGGAEVRGHVEPPLHVVDLLLPLRSRRVGEGVADRRRRDVDPDEVAVALQGGHVRGREVGREVVGGQLDAVHLPRGRALDEVVEGHGRRELAGEVVAQRVGGETEAQAGFSARVDRRDRARRYGARRGEDRCRRDGLQDLAT